MGWSVSQYFSCFFSGKRLNLLFGSVLAAIAILTPSFSEARKVEEVFEHSAWEQSTAAEKGDLFTEILETGILPPGHEIPLLKWYFIEGFSGAGAGEEALEKIKDTPRLPRHLKRTALELVEKGETAAAQRSMEFALGTFPHHSAVLEAHGILLARAGRTDQARDFLERASYLGQTGYLANFHLGGILLQSSRAVDRTRGKILLLGALEGDDPGMDLEIAISLFTNPRIHLTEDEIQQLYQILSENPFFNLNRLTPEMMRIVIRRLQRAMPGKAYEFSKWLVESPRSTVEDRILHIRLARKSGNTRAIAELLHAVSNEQDASLSSHDLQLVQIEKAISAAEDGRYAEAHKILHAMTDSADENRSLPDALKAILSTALPPSEEEKFLKLYLELPVRNLPLRLHVLDRLLEIAPAEQEHWFQYAVDHLLDMDPVLVGAWLQRSGAGGVVLTRFQSVPAQQLTTGQLMALFNVLLEKGEAGKAKEILKDQRNDLQKGLLHLLQIHLLLVENRTGEAQKLWDKARDSILAEGEYHALKPLGALAFELNRPRDGFLVMMNALLAGVSFSEDQLRRINELALQHGTLKQAIYIANELLQLAPDDPLYKNNLAYFLYLEGNVTESSLNSMRALVEEHPEIIQYRLTLALGLLRSGQPLKAQKLLESNSFEWGNLSPQGQMIYAVVLAENGEQSVAKGLVSQLDAEEFLAEEKALLETL